MFTSKQKEELNQAVLEYLIKHNYSKAAEAFQEEAAIQSPAADDGGPKRKDLLEKKWTSIVKLTKQKMDLEKQIKTIREENVCERCEGTQVLDQVLGKSNIGDSLPREPVKYTLQGHRAKITKLTVHPIYSLVASASEDVSIRLWDYEQGEHERTLKGHSGIINFLAFNQNGSLLASCSSDLTIKVWNLETF